jgi:isochorismate synthase
LLQALHPTPAVSGLPKEEAFRFIEENEGYDRLYYSGFLGMLDAERETGIYVNLRCMHIAHDSLTLFAGGGLLASSSLEDEWEETEYKLKTMLDILE